MIICANAAQLPLANDSVQCVITSPPYWGLRKYKGDQELIWPSAERGQADPFICEESGHLWDVITKPTIGGGLRGVIADYEPHRFVPESSHGTCSRCGAWRGGYGLEPTIEMYVRHSVEILRAVRRVLRPDGVCFWNLGDSYAEHRDSKTVTDSLRTGDGPAVPAGSAANRNPKTLRASGLKRKDLVLMPARVALAAQSDGWWVRSDIIWSKPNPMPESVSDRPTDAYEHILMLTKSARYYWDKDAVREKTGNEASPEEYAAALGKSYTNHGRDTRLERGMSDHPENFKDLTHPLGRNMRNVWEFPIQPFKGAHFATFPEELARRCILAASKAGDFVLDPFGGSGTTGRVAIELQRRPVLVDLAYTHDYRELAEARTRNVQLEAFT